MPRFEGYIPPEERVGVSPFDNNLTPEMEASLTEDVKDEIEKEKQEGQKIHIAKYEAQAKKLEIGKITTYEDQLDAGSIVIDGITIIRPEDEQASKDNLKYATEHLGFKVEENTDGKHMPKNRLESVGHFNTDGTSIAFVDEQGIMRVAPYSFGMYKSLVDAGYCGSSYIDVPLHYGPTAGIPADPELREKWKAMNERQIMANKQRMIEERNPTAESYQSRAEEKKTYEKESKIHRRQHGPMNSEEAEKQKNGEIWWE